ncbi:MAG: NuoI/complex I 23 kDa subunit family protein [bacterium]
MADKQKKYGFKEAIYLIEILRGLAVTIKHFFIRRKFAINYPEEKLNITGNTQQVIKVMDKDAQKFEERIEVKMNYRGRHALLVDGDLGRCVACKMCETVCPFFAIYIEPEESPDPRKERSPKVFEIDLTRCAYCGFCVEACPKNALTMTSFYSLVAKQRPDLVIQKKDLMVVVK